MAIDAALLARAISGRLSGPVLRIYSWDRPSLSTGAHQRLTSDLLARCNAVGVPLVRRPTGGSAVLHDGDLTYSVVCRHGGAGVLEAYRRVAACLLDGLRRLGIEAEIGTRRRPAGPLRLERDSSCFATALGADLEAGGLKVCGSAQVRRRDWFLQHGSIPISDPSALLTALLGAHAGSGFAWVNRLRPGTSFADLAGALVAGFEDHWGSAEAVSLDSALGYPEGQEVPGPQACLPNPLVTL